jgi:hypothetical protein
VVGALLTLTAFGAGRFAGSSAQPAVTAAELAPDPRETAASALLLLRAELAKTAPVAAPSEPASRRQQETAPILDPSDLPLEESKIGERARSTKGKARNVPRPRVRDGF